MVCCVTCFGVLKVVALLLGLYEQNIALVMSLVSVSSSESGAGLGVLWLFSCVFLYIYLIFLLFYDTGVVIPLLPSYVRCVVYGVWCVPTRLLFFHGRCFQRAGQAADFR